MAADRDQRMDRTDDSHRSTPAPPASGPDGCGGRGDGPGHGRGDRHGHGQDDGRRRIAGPILGQTVAQPLGRRRAVGGIVAATVRRTIASTMAGA